MEPVHQNRKNDQPGLFDKAPVLPRWGSLAPRIREEVLELLEQLLVEHGRRVLESFVAREEQSDE